MNTIWTPVLPEGEGPKYLALTRALREAIRAGVLPEGARHVWGGQPPASGADAGAVYRPRTCGRSGAGRSARAALARSGADGGDCRGAAADFGRGDGAGMVGLFAAGG